MAENMKPETREISRAGRVTFRGSRLYTDETPDENIRKWGLGWYKKLAEDPQTASALDILYSAAASCWKSASGYIPSKEEWELILNEIVHLPLSIQSQILYATFNIHAPQIIPPKDPSPMELRATDFNRWMIDSYLGCNRREDSDISGRNFGKVILQTLTAIEDGKSVQEIDWRQVEDGEWKGKWGINDIWHRYPEYFSYDENGKLWMKRYLGESRGTIALPENKMIVCIHNMRYENYEGHSMLSPLSYAFDFGRNAEAMNAIAEERFGMPTPMAFLDEQSDMTSEDMLAFLEKMQRGSSLVFNKQDQKRLEDIVLLETNRRGGSEMYNVTIQRNNRLKSKVLLGSALALEEGDSGSYSLAQATAAPNFRRKIQRLLNFVVWTHNTRTLAWSTFFNFPAGTRPGRFCIPLPSDEQFLEKPEKIGPEE